MNKCLQEESQVCYECLKHSSKEMEKCLNCYFAMTCSERCKKTHKRHRCMLKIRQSYLLKIQDKLNSQDKKTKKNILKKGEIN